MNSLLWIAIGDAIGAIARYYFYKFLPRPINFPLATFAVNMVASFLLGLILGTFEYQRGLPNQLKLAIATGFCGALSTFSTFVADDYFLIQGGKAAMALFYTVMSVVLGIYMIKAGDLTAFYLFKRE